MSDCFAYLAEITNRCIQLWSTVHCRAADANTDRLGYCQQHYTGWVPRLLIRKWWLWSLLGIGVFGWHTVDWQSKWSVGAWVRRMTASLLLSRQLWFVFWHSCCCAPLAGQCSSVIGHYFMCLAMTRIKPVWILPWMFLLSHTWTVICVVVRMLMSLLDVVNVILTFVFWQQTLSHQILH